VKGPGGVTPKIAPTAAPALIDIAEDANAAAKAPPAPPSASAALPDSAVVVRGGSKSPGGGASPEGIQNGSGVTVDAQGNVQGVSVQAGMKSIAALAKRIMNKQIGVTTAGKIRDAGGTIEPKPTPGNPDHHVVGDIKADVLSDTLEAQPNPNNTK
jgi:hypothetical protein